MDGKDLMGHIHDELKVIWSDGGEPTRIRINRKFKAQIEKPLIDGFGIYPIETSTMFGVPVVFDRLQDNIYFVIETFY